MRAIIYTRIARDHDDDGEAIARQLAECEAWAAEHGYEVIQPFDDDATGGENED